MIVCIIISDSINDIDDEWWLMKLVNENDDNDRKWW